MAVDKALTHFASDASSRRETREPNGPTGTAVNLCRFCRIAFRRATWYSPKARTTRSSPEALRSFTSLNFDDASASCALALFAAFSASRTAAFRSRASASAVDSVFSNSRSRAATSFFRSSSALISVASTSKGFFFCAADSDDDDASPVDDDDASWRFRSFSLRVLSSDFWMAALSRRISATRACLWAVSFALVCWSRLAFRHRSFASCVDLRHCVRSSRSLFTFSSAVATSETTPSYFEATFLSASSNFLVASCNLATASSYFTLASSRAFSARFFVTRNLTTSKTRILSSKALMASNSVTVFSASSEVLLNDSTIFAFLSKSFLTRSAHRCASRIL
mmetsp:Transcript_9181/g.29779  ORF Transcript_9181/g.29779 Transcript_9181/m.29779 type:complete len:338 (-) Transcript_9181:829-1842(-)